MRIAYIHNEKKIGTGAHYINDLMAKKLRESGMIVKNFYPKNPLMDAPVHLKGLSNILFFYSLLEHREEILKCDVIQGTTYTTLAFLPFSIPVISHFGSTTWGFLKSVSQAKDMDGDLRRIWVALRDARVICELNIRTRRPLRDVAEIEKFVAQRADAIIATSNIVRDDLVGAGIPADHVFVVPNAIEDYWFDQWRPSPIVRRPSLVFLGRLGMDAFTLRLKGLDRLIDIYHSFPHCEKRTIGMTTNGKLVDWMQANVPNHQFLVNKKKSEIPGVLRSLAGSALLIPSRYEGFSLSLIEGMSQGLIPVVYPVGIAPEIIRNGRNGYVVHSQDEAKKAVKRLLEASVSRRGTLAEEARKTARQFSSGGIANKLLRVYREAIMRQKRRSPSDRLKQVAISVLCLAAVLNANVSAVSAQSIASSVSGRILLDVAAHGEAWYVYPPSLERYYLEDGDAAYEALRTFGLGITDEDIAAIPVGIESRFEMADADADTLPDAVEASLGTDEDDSDSDGDGYSDASEVLSGYDPLGSGSVATDAALASRLKGRILLQVETHGEAWYVNPVDAKRYYLGNGEAAYQIMRYLSLGITSANLDQIAVSSSSPRPPFDEASNYEAYSITTGEGTFSVKVAMLRRDTFEMVTDTAEESDCEENCTGKPLATYIEENAAFAGIHGSYFCPPDYPDCNGQSYTFDPPAFNSALDRMINDDSIIYHGRPMVVQTTDGEIHYFHRPDDFGNTLADYESNTGLQVNAAIGNWPSLVENGSSVVAGEPMESAFYNLGTRGGIGWDEEYYYLVIASGATVPNLASIFMALGVDNAMNLDGGGTAALYFDGAYKTGPGRLLPNAVLFREK